MLYRAVVFDRHGPYINLSRVDPKDASVSTGAVRPYIAPPGDGTAMSICTSVIRVTECFLFQERVHPFLSRHIAGILCTQEFERFCCTLGHIFHETVFLSPQFSADAIMFSTGPPTAARRLYPVLWYSMSLMSVKGVHPMQQASSSKAALHSPSKSPMIARANKGNPTFAKTALGYDEAGESSSLHIL